MADSFGANLMAGQLSVDEASPESRFSMSREHFSVAKVSGSRHVLNVKESLSGRLIGPVADQHEEWRSHWQRHALPQSHQEQFVMV